MSKKFGWSASGTQRWPLKWALLWTQRLLNQSLYSGCRALACLLVMLLPWVANAHHSFAMYNQKKLLVLQGTVEEWKWANPHVSLSIVVPGARGEEHWVLAGQSVSTWARIGMRNQDIKAGDKVSVEFNPALDGSNNGYFRSVTVAGGRTFSEAPTTVAPGEKPRDSLANPLEAPP